MEGATLDFKLMCNAFNKKAPDSEKAKAELVKDVCAMANNGTETSYIVIGVGDNRRTFQSADNPHLTSANVHTLVQHAIHPAPAVRVHDLRWNRAPEGMRNKRFVVIQVGPNPRCAYRLARDYIDFVAGYCFRKNEVWVRNGDTTAVATPEQILVIAGKARKAEPKPDYDVVEYEKLPRREQLGAMAKDLRNFWHERGCTIVEMPQVCDGAREMPDRDFRAVLRIRGKDFVFRCGIWDDMSSKNIQGFLIRDSWTFEHGLVFVLKASLTDRAKFVSRRIDFQTPWGNFCTVAPHEIANRMAFRSGNPFYAGNISILTLPKITNTKKMREALGLLLDDFANDDALYEPANTARLDLNKALLQKSKELGTPPGSRWSNGCGLGDPLTQRNFDSMCQFIRTR
jgi:hypothetical protein